MTIDFGTDLDCEDDLNPLGSMVSGPLCLAQALVRRLSTPRGMVIDAPNYGRDLREYLHRGLTPDDVEAIPGEVRGELLKDERIEEVDVLATMPAVDALRLEITCQTAEGPLSLELNVTAAAVVLIPGNA